MAQEMSQDQSPAVVEFGPEVRRPALSRVLTRARLDDRAVPVLAGLGAVAVFVSLVTPWQVTAVDVTEFGGDSLQDVSAGVSDLGVWGAGYLVGVFALAAAAALVLFGAAPARRHARLAGLGVSGALLATVVALGVELSQNSLVYPIHWLGQQQDPAARTGWYLALVGVAAVGVSLYLAGRLPPPPDVEEPADDEEAGSLWRWRRAGKADEPDRDEPPPPADLTVMPVRPFIHEPER